MPQPQRPAPQPLARATLGYVPYTGTMVRAELIVQARIVWYDHDAGGCGGVCLSFKLWGGGPILCGGCFKRVLNPGRQKHFGKGYNPVLSPSGGSRL